MPDTNRDDRLLTTLDNPYNPFVDFSSWLAEDTKLGYNTCGLLARLVPSTEGLTDELIHDVYQDAVDRILEIDPFGVHVAVTPDFYNTASKSAV